MPLAAASLGVLTFNVCGNMIITAPLSAMDTVSWPSSSALVMDTSGHGRLPWPSHEHGKAALA